MAPYHSNVFVKNLPREVDKSGLLQIFERFGSIVCCRILRSRFVDGNSFGFVKFSAIEEAEHAIRAMHLATIADTVVEVRFADQDIKEHALFLQQGMEQSSNSENIPGVEAYESETKRMIKRQPLKEARYLPYSTSNRVRVSRYAPLKTQSSLVPVFAPTTIHPTCLAPVIASRFQLEQLEPIGFEQQPIGYVQPTSFHANSTSLSPTVSHSTAQLSEMSPRKLCSEEKNSKREENSTTSLYVRNLPRNADKLFLYEKFGKFGGIKSVKILLDQNGKCRGIGFVNFISFSSASRAVESMNGVRVGHNDLRVSFQHGYFPSRKFC